MRILITAGSGFLGSHLTAAFRERGHEVSGTSRQPGSGQIRFVLGEDLDPGIALGYEAIIHTAHDFDSAERTVSGTRRLFEVARSSGRPQQWYVGSYSARPDASSEYGQVKYAMERIFLDAGGSVIRPGLLIGNGGMFGRNLRFLMTAPAIPLLNGGRDKVPVLSINDAIRCIILLVENGHQGAWNLFHPHLPEMREIVDVVLAESGRRRPIVVPVPLPLALVAARFGARMRISLPFREDNIRSLQANQVRVHDSDMERLGVVPEGLRDAVRTALRPQP
ncbi:MAG: NAD(P)-dependent oxidoreductase [Bryobacteraceae bacterium]|nr:NAD(P)-dependent oxidoreductase [Bryobacteraceae bacterium]